MAKTPSDQMLPSTSSDTNELEEASESKDIVSSNQSADASRKEKEPIERPTIDFKCEMCSFREKCHYKGTNPPFSKRINFYEDCYVLKDPFSPPPGRHSTKSNCEYFIVLGANCALCNRCVCKGTDCSFFYSRTFCLNCAGSHLKEFPLEIQSKIKKQLVRSSS